MIQPRHPSSFVQFFRHCHHQRVEQGSIPVLDPRKIELKNLLLVFLDRKKGLVAALLFVPIICFYIDHWLLLGSHCQYPK